MNLINSFLNSITMYRLMLYYLLTLVGLAAVLGLLGVIPYSPLDILATAFYITLACKLVNQLISKALKIPSNIESSLITGLILSLIVGPLNLINDFILMTVLAVIAMSSKYFIAIGRKHIFNPAGFAVVAAAVVFGQGASWWVGGLWSLPVILIGGFLILKKLHRFEMAGIFLLTSVIGAFVPSLLSSQTVNTNTLNQVFNFLLASPILFFSSVMLVEPITSPISRRNQIIYGILVGLMFYVYSNLLGIYFPLELALLTGNIFAFLVNPRFNKILRLKKKEQLTPNVTKFTFEPFGEFNFKPGQYLEWTLNHEKPDNRGNRRFFTISSSPTEEEVILTTKFYEKPSTFKQALMKLEPGGEILASNLNGEFTMPEDQGKKLVFIAGGIGVTPFRSMVKYLVDKGESRDIILLYSNKLSSDIVYKDIFDKGGKQGVKTVYVNTDKEGNLDEARIKKEVPDFKDRIFYVSGPEPMVEAFEKMLYGMGVKKSAVKRDYFPGYTS